MKDRLFYGTCGALLLIAAFLLLRKMPPGAFTLAAPKTEELKAAPHQSALVQNNSTSLSGLYGGEVALAYSVDGVFSDTLTAPTVGVSETLPDLGKIDLSLQLSQSASALSGYVDLDSTMIFSTVHTITQAGSPLNVGPYVYGTINGLSVTLRSEQVTTVMDGKSIRRQFQLIGSLDSVTGTLLSGEYRETLWDLLDYPVTIVGNATLDEVIVSSSSSGSVNAEPLLAADLVSTTKGLSITVLVLSNDLDPDGDMLTITAVSKPQNGSATSDGTKVTYQPTANFIGSDSFTYLVSDGKGHSAGGNVTVQVNAPNQTPMAVNDSVVITSGQAIAINVLGNDSDPNGDVLAISQVSDPPSGSALTNGKLITYTSDNGFVGSDSFNYTISDGKGGTAVGQVAVTVNAPAVVNHAPVLTNDSSAVQSGNSITIDVLANDSDVDGDSLTVTIEIAPQHGTALVQNGQIVYTPDIGYVGSDSFTYRVEDGKGGSAIATVSVTVSETSVPNSNVYLPLISR